MGSGSAQAPARVFDAVAPELLIVAGHVARNGAAAEDLLQEVFLQAYRKLDSFKGDSSIGTWLYRLALNHCLDYVRGRRARMDKVTETLDSEASFELATSARVPGGVACPQVSQMQMREAPASIAAV